MLVLFDVNGTLLSLDPVDRALTAAGAPDVLQHWFTRFLQSAGAASLSDRYRPFSEFAEPALRQTLASRGLPETAVQPAMRALQHDLAAQPDAAQCLESLAAAGHRIAALSNSPAGSTRSHLERTGLAGHLDEVLSCDAVRRCKPHPAPYEHALTELDGALAHTVLVAAHGWDVMGADAVGIRTVWVRRLEREWALPGGPPDLVADTLADVPAALSDLSGL